jgi:nuclear pore complex protein Nup107
MAREDPDSSASWFEEFKESPLPEELLEEYNTTGERLTTTVQNLWELEALVRALDAMETISSAAGITRE